jgi:hypothetical protein
VRVEGLRVRGHLCALLDDRNREEHGRERLLVPARHPELVALLLFFIALEPRIE